MFYLTLKLCISQIPAEMMVSRLNGLENDINSNLQISFNLCRALVNYWHECVHLELLTGGTGIRSRVRLVRLLTTVIDGWC